MNTEETTVSTLAVMVPTDAMGELERALAEAGVASLRTESDCFNPVDMQIGGVDGMMMLSEIVERFGAHTVSPMGGRMPPTRPGVPSDHGPRYGMNGTLERNHTYGGMNGTFERNRTRRGMGRMFARNVTILVPINTTSDVEQTLTEANMTAIKSDDCFIPLIVQVEGREGIMLLNEIVQPFGAIPIIQRDARTQRQSRGGTQG
ncbi:MAG: hypothetical protein QF415_17300, partial [Candidatus Undinarchaeales archaeon]|nr:hypothetical protein [Candidatus Undinarchaeales archaeon]